MDLGHVEQLNLRRTRAALAIEPTTFPLRIHVFPSRLQNQLSLKQKRVSNGVKSTFLGGANVSRLPVAHLLCLVRTLTNAGPFPAWVCVGVSVIRVLIFRYVGNLQRIFDYSPLDPSQDFATQM